MTRIRDSVGHVIYQCDILLCNKTFATPDEKSQHEIHDHFTALKGLGCYICDKK